MNPFELSKLAKQVADAKQLPQRKVTIKELWTALVQSGCTPREAKLQCNIVSGLGGEIRVGDEMLRVN